MARILLGTATVPGHVNPVLPIARELTGRGHEVVWLSGRGFRERIEATGAEFHPWPRQIDSTVEDFFALHPKWKELRGLAAAKYVLRTALEVIPDQMEDVDAVLARFPAQVLVGDPFVFGPIVKAELAGLPSVLFSFTPLALTSRDAAPYGLGMMPGSSPLTRTRNRLLNFLVGGIMFRDINAFASDQLRELGAAPIKGPFFRGAFLRPTLVMHMSTLAFEYPRSDLPGNLRYIGPILLGPDPSYDPPSWWSDIAGSTPVVLVNQGSVAVEVDDLIAPAIEGLKGEQMLVIAVPVEAGALGETPANVHAEPFVPFGNLLPHVDVMVTNGGYGGTQLALAHGVPLVVAGNTEDKMEVAARVEWSGSGINLRKKNPSPAEVRDAVVEVLATPSYRENARRIQADFARYDAPKLAADLLETLASREPIPPAVY